MRRRDVKLEGRLTLSGIPPFPGSIAKFFIFKNVIAAGCTAYGVLGLVGSYLGIYFYLRVTQLPFMSAEGSPQRKCIRPSGVRRQLHLPADGDS